MKDLGKRIKAKGLQKLKFYCQSCEKQCRDANGFKCHLTSESHLRQMKVFSENAGSFMDRFSKDFEKMYLDTLRMRHSTARVNANNVYQEVIQDKFHIHMNATIWASLTDFCKYLGKTGKCVVEETERGWYVSYIERDISKLHREETQKKRQAAEQAAEIAAQQLLEQQRVEAAKALDRAGGVLHAEATNLERDVGTAGEEERIQLAIKTKEKKKTKSSAGFTKLGKSVFGGDDSDDESDNNKEQVISKAEDQTLKISSTEADMQKRTHFIAKRTGQSQDSETQEISSRKRSRQDQSTAPSSRNHSTTKETASEDESPWLHLDILVRVINKKLASGRYYRRKAMIDKVIDDFTAEVIVVDGDDRHDKIAGDVLRLDQDDLETVAPKHVDQKVRIVRGEYRGKKAVTTALDRKKYMAALKLKDGTVLERVNFDDFSLVA